MYIIPFICLGTIRILDGKRRVGWFLLCLGIVLDAVITASVCIGCFPLGWRGCLHETKQADYHNRGSSRTNSETREAKSKHDPLWGTTYDPLYGAPMLSGPILNRAIAWSD